MYLLNKRLHTKLYLVHDTQITTNEMFDSLSDNHVLHKQLQTPIFSIFGDYHTEALGISFLRRLNAVN
jgi:hypothetical protein